MLLQRALLAAHTFKPDQADAERWLDELFGRVLEALDVRDADEVGVQLFGCVGLDLGRQFSVNGA